MDNSDLTIKLLIDESSNKVVFAEAGKCVVDFLLGLLTLPLGTVVNLLSCDGDVHQNSASVANLYRSLQCLKSVYFQSDGTKDSLLDITRPFSTLPNPDLLPAASPAPFTNGRRQSNYPCSSCLYNKSQNQAISSGYVKSVGFYTVLDDLTVTPPSAVSCITVLSNYKVKDVTTLKEKSVVLTPDKALQLLKASLQSKTVLTDVFLA